MASSEQGFYVKTSLANFSLTCPWKSSEEDLIFMICFQCICHPTTLSSPSPLFLPLNNHLQKFFCKINKIKSLPEVWKLWLWEEEGEAERRPWFTTSTQKLADLPLDNNWKPWNWSFEATLREFWKTIANVWTSVSFSVKWRCWIQWHQRLLFKF